METLTVIRPVETPVMVSIIETIEPYLDGYMMQKDTKDSSKRVYLNNLQQFFAWVNDKGYLLSEISRPHIIEYKKHLLATGKAINTVSGYLSSIRGFFEWAEGYKIYPNIAKGVKAPRNNKEFRKEPLSLKQTKQLHSHLKQKAYGLSNPEAIQPMSLTDIQNYVMINLMLRMGLRCIEVSRLNVQDMYFLDGERVLGIRGKGYEGISREIQLSEHVYNPIKQYLKLRGNPSQGPVFVSLSNHDNGKRITTRSISRIVKTALQAIGIDDRAITAHSLRHTAAHRAMDNGATEAQVRDDLGHSSINTTMLYIKQRQKYNRIHNSAMILNDKIFD